MTKDGDAIKKLETQLGSWDREDFHDFRKAIDSMGIRLAVIDERQQVNGGAIQRTENMVGEIHEYVRGRVSDLEKQMAVLAAVKPEGIPSHQRNAILIAAIGLGSALAAACQQVLKTWPITR